MSSWLGACMIAGCAIGATGIVIHHYSSSAYQIPPKITYMINEDEWVKGVVEEFNNKVGEYVEFRFAAVYDKQQYGKNNFKIEKYEGKPELHRNECVTLMADAYRKEKNEEWNEGYKKWLDSCPKVEKTTETVLSV